MVDTQFIVEAIQNSNLKFTLIAAEKYTAAISVPNYKKVLSEIAKRKKTFVNIAKKRNKNNPLWKHRYSDAFGEIGDSEKSDIEAFFCDLSISDQNIKNAKIKSFIEERICKNPHAYIVAEIIRPISRIIIEKIEKKHGVEEAVNIRLFLESHIRWCAIRANEIAEQKINEAERELENTLLSLTSMVGSDRIQNRVGLVLSDFREIYDCVKKQNYKTLEEIAGVYNEKFFCELEEITEQIGKKFFTHGVGRTPVRFIIFLLPHYFQYFISIKIENYEDALDRVINVDEMSFLKICYPIFLNAKMYGATEVKVEISLKASEAIEISLTNNGRDMSPLERDNCFKKFFSGHSRMGLGLYLAQKHAQRSGALLSFQNNQFKINFNTRT